MTSWSDKKNDLIRKVRLTAKLDVTTWLTKNYNPRIAQYFTK